MAQNVKHLELLIFSIFPTKVQHCMEGWMLSWYGVIQRQNGLSSLHQKSKEPDTGTRHIQCQRCSQARCWVIEVNCLLLQHVEIILVMQIVIHAILICVIVLSQNRIASRRLCSLRCLGHDLRSCHLILSVLQVNIN